MFKILALVMTLGLSAQAQNLSNYDEELQVDVEATNGSTVMLKRGAEMKHGPIRWQDYDLVGVRLVVSSNDPYATAQLTVGRSNFESQYVAQKINTRRVQIDPNDAWVYADTSTLLFSHAPSIAEGPWQIQLTGDVQVIAATLRVKAIRSTPPPRPPEPPRPPRDERLYDSAKTTKDCEYDRGSVSDVGYGKICSFSGATCPSGWRKFRNFTRTENVVCKGNWLVDYKGGRCPGAGSTPPSADTGYHFFGDRPQEMITVRGAGQQCGPACGSEHCRSNLELTCAAQVIEVGCN